MNDFPDYRPIDFQNVVFARVKIPFVHLVKKYSLENYSNSKITSYFRKSENLEER